MSSKLQGCETKSLYLTQPFIPTLKLVMFCYFLQTPRAQNKKSVFFLDCLVSVTSINFWFHYSRFQSSNLDSNPSKLTQSISHSKLSLRNHWHQNFYLFQNYFVTKSNFKIQFWLIWFQDFKPSILNWLISSHQSSIPLTTCRLCTHDIKAIDSKSKLQNQSSVQSHCVRQNNTSNSILIFFFSWLLVHQSIISKSNAEINSKHRDWNPIKPPTTEPDCSTDRPSLSLIADNNQSISNQVPNR